MFLIFDTETTGLPRNWNAPLSDAENWPRCIQIAWQLHDESCNGFSSGLTAWFIFKSESCFWCSANLSCKSSRDNFSISDAFI